MLPHSELRGVLHVNVVVLPGFFIDIIIFVI